MVHAKIVILSPEGKVMEKPVQVTNALRDKRYYRTVLVRHVRIILKLHKIRKVVQQVNAVLLNI